MKGVGPRRAADLERVGPAHGRRSAAALPAAIRRPRGAAAGREAASWRRPPRSSADVVTSGIRPTRRPGFRLFELVVKDASGPVRAVFPNQSFLRDVFHPGQRVVLYGALEYRGGGLQFTNPEYEIVRGEGGGDEDDATVHTGRIVPIYEKAGSVTPRMQRSLVASLLASTAREPGRPVAGRDPPATRAARSGAGDRRSALSVAGHADRGAERVSSAGAATARSSRSSSCSRPAWSCESASTPAIGKRGRSSSTTGCANPRGRCCRSSSRPGRRRRSARSSLTCSGPSR